MITRIRSLELRGLRPRVGIGLALATAAISGVSVWVNASAVRAFGDPVLFTTLKNAVAAVLLVGLATLLVDRIPTRLRSASRRDLIGLVAVGIVGGSVPFVLFFSGLAAASAPSAAIIHKTLFVWVALLAAVLLRERLGLAQIAALAVLLMAQLLVQPADGLSWTSGEWMIALATGLWAVEVVVARRLVAHLPAAIGAAARMSIGLVVLVTWVVVTGTAGTVASLTIEQWVWVAITGVLLTGYVTTWYAALRRAPASAVTAVLTLGAPVTAALQLVSDGRVPTPTATAGYGAMFLAAGLLGWLALRATTRGRAGVIALDRS